MISPTDLFHSSPAPHFKTFHVFLIYCPKCPSFRTIQSYAPNVALPKVLTFSPNHPTCSKVFQHWQAAVCHKGQLITDPLQDTPNMHTYTGGRVCQVSASFIWRTACQVLIKPGFSVMLPDSIHIRNLSIILISHIPYKQKSDSRTCELRRD